MINNIPKFDSYISPSLKNSRVLIIFIFAIAVKLTIFSFLIMYPLKTTSMGTISPILESSATDFTFYKYFADLYFTSEESIWHFIWRVHVTDFFAAACEYSGAMKQFSCMDFDFKHCPDECSILGPFSQPNIAPPLLPFLIYITNYTSGNTIYLSIIFLLIGAVWTWVWILWMSRRNVPTSWVVMFSLLPNPIWFTLHISTDIIFALMFAAFYFAYFDNRWHKNYVTWLLPLILLTLTRTNSISIVCFVSLDILFSRNIVKRDNILLLALLSLTFPICIFYLPSFIGSTLTLEKIQFFGWTQAEYFKGIFYDNLRNFLTFDGAIIKWLDRLLSIIALIFAKVLYLVGLRPSFSDNVTIFTIIRFLPGIIFLPGLIWFLIKTDVRQRLMVFLFLLPIIIGPSQDRYLLPLQGILFFYGLSALRELSHCGVRFLGRRG